MVRAFGVLAIFLLSGSYALAEGFYAGADIRVTNMEESEQNLSYQNRPMGWRVHAGYQFSELFALEGSYVDTGEAKDTVLDESVRLKMSGYSMSLVFQNDMTTPNLFTKLGYHSSKIEASVPGVSFNDDVDGVAAGLGFRQKMRNNLAIRGEVDWFESDLDNFWSVGIGLQFSFGN